MARRGVIAGQGQARPGTEMGRHDPAIRRSGEGDGRAGDGRKRRDNVIVIPIHAALGWAALVLANAQSSHCVRISTSRVSTLAPHQMRNPGGASR
jgi:hypothetical protein